MADSTLYALFPGVPLTIAGERLSVRPIVLSELPVAQRVIEAWGRLIMGGEADLEAWADLQTLMGTAVGKSLVWVQSLGSDDFDRLLASLIAVNQEDLLVGEDGAGSHETVSWARVAQTLVSAGHTLDRVERMTLPQLRVLLGEADRALREQLARDITAASFSMSDGKTIQKVTRELRCG